MGYVKLKTIYIFKRGKVAALVCLENKSGAVFGCFLYYFEVMVE